MLCLSSFEPYSHWVPLISTGSGKVISCYLSSMTQHNTNDTRFLSHGFSWINFNCSSIAHNLKKGKAQ